MPVLEARNLTVSRDRRLVIPGFDLRLDGGRVVAILGPNGAGKTSAMLALLGLIPCGGTVTLDGEELRAADQRRRIGFVPQDGGIPTAASAQEWISLQAASRGATKTEVTQICQELQVPVGRRVARRLSGGERRRVSLAAALVGEPDVLVLDEPTAGLDAELRATAIAAVTRAARAGSAVLLSTHLLDEIVECADEILVMQQGRITRRGTPSELLETSATAWTPAAQAAQLRKIFGESA